MGARDDAGQLVDVDAQATSDRLASDLLVLWHEEGAELGVQRCSRLEDFERAHGPYTGPVWQLHWSVCANADRPLGLVLSERGRKLLVILTGPVKRKRG